MATSSLNELKWYQITTLLANADEVLLKKSKLIDDVRTEDGNTWYIEKIEWTFTEPREMKCIIKTKGKDPVQQQILTEEFDFNSPDLKFYYDVAKNRFYAEVMMMSKGKVVRYQYTFTFKGTMEVTNCDFLKESCVDSTLKLGNNRIVAL